jgi:hypothetical protein
MIMNASPELVPIAFRVNGPSLLGRVADGVTTLLVAGGAGRSTNVNKVYGGQRLE